MPISKMSILWLMYFVHAMVCTVILCGGLRFTAGLSVISIAATVGAMAFLIFGWVVIRAMSTPEVLREAGIEGVSPLVNARGAMVLIGGVLAGAGLVNFLS